MMKKKVPKGYSPIVFADMLDKCACCEEPLCGCCWDSNGSQDVRKHYSDCGRCIGPTEDDVDYLELNGKLYGKRK